MTYLLLSLLGLGAGFAGLAYGWWLDREERQIAALRMALRMNIDAMDRVALAFRQFGVACEQANRSIAAAFKSAAELKRP
jgi:hypothetical protein